MVNIWRGERVIQAVEDGPSATLAATHECLANACSAVGVTSLQALLEAVATLHPDSIRNVIGAFEIVDGDPQEVFASAPGANGLDAIADTLIGLIKGLSEEEQQLEKELSAAHAEAAQAAVVQAALSPLIAELTELIQSSKVSKQPG